jgi:hypothetical protein
VLAISTLALAALLAAPPPAPPGRGVDLVVLVAIDQLPTVYFERFGPQLTGGLGRLRRGSTFYTGAIQDHAMTETAPGHATMLSGREPAGTGIVSNNLGVSDSLSPLLGVSTAPGASPRRFRGTTLVDWMAALDPAARALSVSTKDRGAILPIGRSKQSVYWYRDGEFTTSRWYRDELPPWVRDYNARRGPARLAGRLWTLLLPDSAYAERDSVAFERGGRDFVFPHPMPDDTVQAVRRAAYVPWADSLALDFAWQGVRQLDLGRTGHLDLLSLSLSATDEIGHGYGPDSREIHDQVLRVDRWLGVFLDSLATRVPPQHALIVLTSDHGIQSIPEIAQARGAREAGRVHLGAVVIAARAELARRDPSDFGIGFEKGLVWADRGALAARGIDADSLAEAMATAARALTGIARVFTPRSLAMAPATDREARLWRRSLPADFDWLICATTRPGVIWSSGRNGTEHATTNAADMGVPIAFMGPGIPAATIGRPVRSVDIAPTLAALLGLRPAEPLDGEPLPEVVGRKTTGTSP